MDLSCGFLEEENRKLRALKWGRKQESFMIGTQLPF